MINEEELQSLYQNSFNRINHILELFNAQFGEDKVDMIIPPKYSFTDFKRWYKETLKQMPTGNIRLEDFFVGSPFTFLVYWPEVKITNETDKSHIIKDLYAKVEVTIDGKLSLYSGFLLNRTTYTEAEWQSDYLHSHIQGIPKDNITRFSKPCLGSGPIKASIENLKREYDEDWFEEFLYELDRYVYVESIAGVPWRKIGNISATNTTSRYAISIDTKIVSRLYDIPSSYNQILKDFTVYLATYYPFLVNYNGTNYTSAFTTIEFWLRISAIFIEWYNTNHDNYEFTVDDLRTNNVLIPVVVKENNIFPLRSSSYPAPTGDTVLTFKGQVKPLVVTKTVINTQENIQHVLHKDYIGNLYCTLINYINYYYGE